LSTFPKTLLMFTLKYDINIRIGLIIIPCRGINRDLDCMCDGNLSAHLHITNIKELFA